MGLLIRMESVASSVRHYTLLKSWECVSTRKRRKYKVDNCFQITDCMNCSLSQTCSWSTGRCQTNPLKTSHSRKSTAIVSDFLEPAWECGDTKACGDRNLAKHSGNFTFVEDTVQKSQVCLWYVSSNYKHPKIANLVFQAKGIASKPWENPPTFFVRYCYHRMFMEACQLTRLNFRDGQSLSVIGSEIAFFTWVEESLVTNAKDFVVQYEITEQNGFSNLLILLRIFYRVALFCTIFSCMAASCQKFNTFSRRRRLVRELDGLEMFRLPHDDDHDEVRPVTVEEIMDNNRLVNRVVYGGNTAEFEQTDCPICLESFEAEEHLVKLTCKHLFHINCFQDWVKAVNVQQAVKCPVCNRVLM